MIYFLYPFTFNPCVFICKVGFLGRAQSWVLFFDPLKILVFYIGILNHWCSKWLIYLDEHLQCLYQFSFCSRVLYLIFAFHSFLAFCVFLYTNWAFLWFHFSNFLAYHLDSFLPSLLSFSFFSSFLLSIYFF